MPLSCCSNDMNATFTPYPPGAERGGRAGIGGHGSIAERKNTSCLERERLGLSTIDCGM
jgi:hypothetical protein